MSHKLLSPSYEPSQQQAPPQSQSQIRILGKSDKKGEKEDCSTKTNNNCSASLSSTGGGELSSSQKKLLAGTSAGISSSTYIYSTLPSFSVTSCSSYSNTPSFSAPCTEDIIITPSPVMTSSVIMSSPPSSSAVTSSARPPPPSITQSAAEETEGGGQEATNQNQGMKKRIEKFKQQAQGGAVSKTSLANTGGATSARESFLSSCSWAPNWPPLGLKGGSNDKDLLGHSSLGSPSKNKKFGANIADLQVHLAGRRSSCSALPGIVESKVEEEEDSSKTAPGAGSLYFKLRGHQERSHSICLLRDPGADDDDDQDKTNSLIEEVETPAEFVGGLCTPEDSRVQSSRTWPQSAIRSAAAIDESLLEGLEKGDSTFCESLGQIPQINVCSQDADELSMFSCSSSSSVVASKSASKQRLGDPPPSK